MVRCTYLFEPQNAWIQGDIPTTTTTLPHPSLSPTPGHTNLPHQPPPSISPLPPLIFPLCLPSPLPRPCPPFPRPSPPLSLPSVMSLSMSLSLSLSLSLSCPCPCPSPCPCLDHNSAPTSSPEVNCR